MEHTRVAALNSGINEFCIGRMVSKIGLFKDRSYAQPTSCQGSYRRIDCVMAGRLYRFPSKYWPLRCKGE
jgi:hypothetical protein